MKVTSTLRLFLVLTTMVVSYALSAQTDSVVWTNTSKPPTGYPASAFDSAGYAYSSSILTAHPYTVSAKLGFYKLNKAIAKTSVYLPFGLADTTQQMLEYAPTDTGVGNSHPVVATTGSWEAGGSVGFEDRYIEFSVTASAAFTITSVVAPIYSAGSSTGTGTYEYSTDGTNFTVLLAGKSALKPLKSDFAANVITVPSVQLNAGQTFYLRFVPFQNTASTKKIAAKGIGFERLAIYGSAGTVSPVKFGTISASLINSQAVVSWVSESEINVASYSIEKCTDGFNFIAAGIVTASKSKSYSFVDKTPASGVNYYRIKSIDANGAVTYSSVVKVLSLTTAGVSVSPNPVANHKLNVQFAGAAGQYALSLYATSGQKVYSSSVTANTLTSLALPSSIKAGIYQLELVSGTTKVSKTILVQ